MKGHRKVDGDQEGFVKSVAVLNRGLVVLEQQELVSNIQEGKGDQCDGDEDGDDSAEGHRDEEGGDEVGVSLANGVNLVGVEVNVFLLCFSRGGFEAASGVPAFLDATNHAGEEEFNYGEGDVEDLSLIHI